MEGAWVAVAPRGSLHAKHTLNCAHKRSAPVCGAIYILGLVQLWPNLTDRVSEWPCGVGQVPQPPQALDFSFVK